MEELRQREPEQCDPDVSLGEIDCYVGLVSDVICIFWFRKSLNEDQNVGFAYGSWYLRSWDWRPHD